MTKATFAVTDPGWLSQLATLGAGEVNFCFDQRVDFSAVMHAPGGYAEPMLVAVRRGQGAFRLLVMDAYEHRA